MAPRITETQGLAQGRKREFKRKEKQVAAWAAPALRATWEGQVKIERVSNPCNKINNVPRN